MLGPDTLALRLTLELNRETLEGCLVLTSSHVLRMMTSDPGCADQAVLTQALRHLGFHLLCCVSP